MSQSRINADNDRQSCWVCFATDEDDTEAAWVRPCRCRGTTKWVHQSCLQRWVDEKQRGNSTAKVACPQCNTEYIIIFPKLGPVVYLMDIADKIIYKMCPFVAGGMFIGSVYWTAVTYGAVTVMQVLGHKEGLNVMERADPLFLLIGLPTIPVMLILGKMVRWEDYILRLWRKHSSKLPLLNYLFPDEARRLLWCNAARVHRVSMQLPERRPCPRFSASKHLEKMVKWLQRWCPNRGFRYPCGTANFPQWTQMLGLGN
ncbi:hypothetical protein C0Q70_10071 [Pomacea canaliculata]|uniref:E3 ubiquitin-protein ligase MARCHF5 n=1 Tax=Pomacea canaliculata TaxID=400727 RepID=A0A2T7PBK7_POMCA|nr:hypothetical protein C0Q70_10071 [Pomacea canaliculata]